MEKFPNAAAPLVVRKELVKGGNGTSFVNQTAGSESDMCSKEDGVTCQNAAQLQTFLTVQPISVGSQRQQM